jgi:putative heme degradation protein
MTEQTAPLRRSITDSAETVLQRLPQIGKLMIIGKTDAVTHERIGPVESVARDGDALVCRGAAHDSRIEAAEIVSIVADTSSIMRDQVYPRIDFNDVAGKPIVSIVGFGGLEPFEAALSGLAMEVLPGDKETPERKERPDVAVDDPGRGPLEAALATGLPITIAFEKQGFSQRWTGIVPKVSPAMGFINVMDGDFHLHLPGGTVARWMSRTVEGQTELVALNAEGEPIGLSLIAADSTAFAPAPQKAE